jgi:pantoate kinase
MASAVVAAPQAVAMARAFSPGHVTGFFEIPQSLDGNPLHRGSRGAGFSINAGISTTAYIYEGNGSRVLINGKAAKARDAEVSQWVIDQYLQGADRPYFVKVEHEIDIPVGFGLGSSGAAALSLSYALNEASGSKLGRAEAAQLAHRAEIACRTGLGTVIAEYSGGFEMRRAAGAPGIGTVDSIPLHGYKAIILCMAPISTKSFLAGRMSEINGLGGRMMERLAESRDVDEFLSMSFQFAQTLGLTEGLCKAPLQALATGGFSASVALFGQTVFTLVPEGRAEEAAGILSTFEGTLLVRDIDGAGARVL